MNVIRSSTKKASNWLESTIKILIKRGVKDVKKLKGHPPKPTPWDIIKQLT